MLAAADKIAIFQSVPKSVTVNLVPYTAMVEYADRGVISDLLKTNPLVVTLHYYNDRPDKVETPTNKMLAKDSTGADIVYTIGERRQVTLSVNIYAADSASLPADDLISAYLDLLLPWTLNTLMDLVDVADRSPVSDLSYLQNFSSRRQMDISIRHIVGTNKTIGTIETVTPPGLTLS